MANRCGAKTRANDKCKRAPMANGRCNLHGGKSTGPRDNRGNTNAFKHGFYSDALQPEERQLWDRVEIGTLDDEIRLAKVKLHRLVRLSGSAEVADLIDSALELTHRRDTHPALGSFEKREIKVKAPQYADLILQALDQVRKLEMARAQMRLTEHNLQADEGASNDDITGFEVVPYED